MRSVVHAICPVKERGGKEKIQSKKTYAISVHEIEEHESRWPGLDCTIAWWYPGRRAIILLIVLPRAVSPSAVVIPAVLLVLPGCALTFVLARQKKKTFTGISPSPTELASRLSPLSPPSPSSTTRTRLQIYIGDAFHCHFQSSYRVVITVDPRTRYATRRLRTRSILRITRLLLTYYYEVRFE